MKFLALMLAATSLVAQADFIGNRALLVHPDEFTDKWIERAKDLGLKTLAIHPTGGGTADASLTNLLSLCRTEDFRKRVDRAIDAGLQIEYELHAGTWLLPRDLFAAHPECFRMDAKGVRTKKANFCVSNPETLRIVSRRACELAKGLYRSSHRFYFWLDDESPAFCHCPTCARLTPSDQQLVALNAMVRALRADDPSAKLAYLAYGETLPAPRTVKPEAGIFLEFAPISRAHDKPLAEQRAVRVEDLDRLLAHFGKADARVLEYWYDNSLRSRWEKPERRFEPANEVIRADLAWYARRGFAEVAVFACFLGPKYESTWGEPDLSAFRPASGIVFRGFHGERGGRDRTTFRCWRDGARVRFSFNVWDDTVCAAATGVRERNLEMFDRVEVFFSPTADLTKNVCCIEMDPLGRVLDYRMAKGRPFDFAWRARTLRVAGRVIEGGYEVEGSIEVRELEAEGVNLSDFYIGAFRADLIEANRLAEWYSARRPDARPAFFHQPNMFFPASL